MKSVPSPTISASPRIAAVLTGCLLLVVLSPLTSQTVELREIHRLSASEHTLSIVAAVPAGRDATLWVSQPQDGDVVALHPGDDRLIHIGSRGEGPGAFRSVGSLVPVADLLWVLDATLARGTWFQGDGRVDSTVPIVRPAAWLAPTLLSAGPEGVEWLCVWSPGRAVYSATVDWNGQLQTSDQAVSQWSFDDATCGPH